MIEVRDAIEAAKAFAKEAFGEDELNYLRLEEIELSEDEEHWKVTLGWITPEDVRRTTGSLASITGQSPKMPRTYKVFYVDSDSGEVESMKIRSV